MLQKKNVIHHHTLLTSKNNVVEENAAEVDAVTEESHPSTNLNGLLLQHVLRKRGRPKGSDESVIDLPKKRFRNKMPPKLVLRCIGGGA